ncbi:hypothetical protein CWB65_19575, partial [Pseudoalteromonas sp. S554]
IDVLADEELDSELSPSQTEQELSQALSSSIDLNSLEDDFDDEPLIDSEFEQSDSGLDTNSESEEPLPEITDEALLSQENFDDSQVDLAGLGADLELDSVNAEDFEELVSETPDGDTDNDEELDGLNLDEVVSDTTIDETLDASLEPELSPSQTEQELSQALSSNIDLDSLEDDFDDDP